MTNHGSLDGVTDTCSEPLGATGKTAFLLHEQCSFSQPLFLHVQSSLVCASRDRRCMFSITRCLFSITVSDAQEIPPGSVERQLQRGLALERPRDRAATRRPHAPAHARRICGAGTPSRLRQSPEIGDRV